VVVVAAAGMAVAVVETLESLRIWVDSVVAAVQVMLRF
jgi:hypothetical protein